MPPQCTQALGEALRSQAVLAAVQLDEQQASPGAPQPPHEPFEQVPLPHVPPLATQRLPLQQPPLLQALPSQHG